eukprot:14853429-Alexandrium_andersonii.AAC.1
MGLGVAVAHEGAPTVIGAHEPRVVRLVQAAVRVRPPGLLVPVQGRLIAGPNLDSNRGIVPATPHGRSKVSTFSHRSGGVARTRPAGPQGGGRHATSQQAGGLVGAINCPRRSDGSRSGAVRGC